MLSVKDDRSRARSKSRDRHGDRDRDVSRSRQSTAPPPYSERRERSSVRQPEVPPPSARRRDRSSVRQPSSPSPPPAASRVRHTSSTLTADDIAHLNHGRTERQRDAKDSESGSDFSRRRPTDRDQERELERESKLDAYLDSHARSRPPPDAARRGHDDDSPLHEVDAAERMRLKRMSSAPNRESLPTLSRGESLASSIFDEDANYPRHSASPPQHLDLQRAHSSSLGIPSAGGHSRRMSVGGLPPGSPLLEAYRGTYQMISPRPSPMVKPNGDDGSDISDLDFTMDSDDSDGSEDGGAITATRSRSAVSPLAARSKKPGHQSKADVRQIVSEISKACKKKDLYDPVFLETLPRQSHEQLQHIRELYRDTFPAGKSGKGINFTKHIKATFGTKEPYAKALWYLSLGMWESEANWANTFYQDSASKNELVIEALAGRSNYEIRQIKDAFLDNKYANSLENCIYAEFPSTKFKKAVLIILEGERDPEHMEVRSSSIRRDVEIIHKIVTSKDTRNTGETELYNSILKRSDKFLKELQRQYQMSYGKRLDEAILARSNNLVGELLAHMLVGVRDATTRDARLLHAALKTHSTDLMISRFIRVHWDQEHMEDVKEAYERMYDEQLAMAVAKDKTLQSKVPELGECFCQMIKYRKPSK